MARDEHSVSPVVGTVLVLGISVAGIAAVLYWGTPLIQDMQDRNAHNAMQGEFLELRHAARVLTGVDASRHVGMQLPAGALSVDPGGRMLVGVSFDAGCRPGLDSWSDGDDTITLATMGTCTAPSDATVYLVQGDTLTEVSSAYGGGTITVAQDVSQQSDWLIRFDDGTTLTEYWLLTTAQVSWKQTSTVGQRAVHYAWGAVLSEHDEAIFAQGYYQVNEDAGQDGDYFLRLTSLSGDGGAIDAPGDRGLFIALQGVSQRVSSDSVYAISFETAGPLAEALCNTFATRDLVVSSASYGDCARDEDLTGEDDDTYQVAYPETLGAAFRMEMIHAQVRVELEV